jgi:hypothetical protein
VGREKSPSPLSLVKMLQVYRYLTVSTLTDDAVVHFNSTICVREVRRAHGRVLWIFVQLFINADCPIH